MIAPIHYQDRLMAWSATFVHVMDIGAMSPGGNSPGATEICHEGLRIPGLKLVERGRIRQDVFDTLINMTRQPVLGGSTSSANWRPTTWPGRAWRRCSRSTARSSTPRSRRK